MSRGKSKECVILEYIEKILAGYISTSLRSHLLHPDSTLLDNEEQVSLEARET